MGVKTWSLTLREKSRLGVIENRVLRRIFGLKRDEVTGEWKKLHNEELNDVHSSHNFFRVMGVTCNTHGGEERCIQGFGEET